MHWNAWLFGCLVATASMFKQQIYHPFSPQSAHKHVSMKCSSSSLPHNPIIFSEIKMTKKRSKKHNTENPPGNTEISGRRAKPHTQTHTNERRNPFRKFTVPLNYVATIQCVMWCVFVCSFLSSSFFSYALFPRILFSSGAPNLVGTLYATHSIFSNTSFRRRNKNSSLLSALFCGCCCCCGCGFGLQEQVHRTHWHI